MVLITVKSLFTGKIYRDIEFTVETFLNELEKFGTPGFILLGFTFIKEG